MSDDGTDEPLARSGVVVVSLDFRMPPDGKYPASLAGRELRDPLVQSARRGVDSQPGPDRHPGRVERRPPGDARRDAPAATRAMSRWRRRTRDRRVGARRRPVLAGHRPARPLSLREEPEGRRQAPKQAEQWVACHDKYWPDETEMAEGNPTLALERGEKVEMPPVLYLQGTADVAHPEAQPRPVHRGLPQSGRAGGAAPLRRRRRSVHHQRSEFTAGEGRDREDHRVRSPRARLKHSTPR